MDEDGDENDNHSDEPIHTDESMEDFDYDKQEEPKS